MTPPDPSDPTSTPAVTGPDPEPDPAQAPHTSADERTGDPATLAAATQALRQHVDDRWVEVADWVLSKALTSTRRSLPVRAHDLGGGGALYVGEHVLTAYLRDAIAPIPAAAPTRIHIHADTGHHCTGVTIEITVQYNEPVIPIADQIRHRTETMLQTLLGPGTPPVTVATMHVHVSDVTTDDPHTGRPQPHLPRGNNPKGRISAATDRPDG